MPMPVSSVFGMDRGEPIDRYYIRHFMEAHQASIRGVVVEIAEPRYALGYSQQISKIEVLHVDPAAKGATLIGDLSKPETLPENIADCFICTQTYQFIYDVPSALRGSAKLLKSGGSLLGTFPCITQISRFDMDRWGEYWRFTQASVGQLVREAFPGANVDVRVYGNLFAAKAMLEGLAVEDLPAVEALDIVDQDYPVIIAVKVTKI